MSPSYRKGCLYDLWTTKEWGIDQEIRFDVPAGQVRLNGTQHSIQVSAIQQALPATPRLPSKFDSIKKIFVDEFGGNTGATLRDHVIGILANSGRFVAVEEPAIADAIIRGRSDSQEQATKVSSAGKGTATGSAGAVFGTVIAGARSSSASTSVSERVVVETISLRLTLKSGEVIWAWEESKPCYADLVRPEFATITKARCAVQDLKDTAK